MSRRDIGRRVLIVRERRMWTQGRLADEAGLSPTTVSGIESGRISRPHFGTVRKLAGALGVDPEELLSPTALHEEKSQSAPRAPRSLEWAISAPVDEFERRLESARLPWLSALSKELEEEQSRLHDLYGEASSTEERRRIKSNIRSISAQHGSVSASIEFHPDRGNESSNGPRGTATSPDAIEQTDRSQQ